MDCTLMFPYTYQDESEFKVMDGYYSDGEYADKVRNEFESTSDKINNSMVSSNKGVSSAFISEDEQLYQVSEKVAQNASKVGYSQCKCKLYDMGASDKTVDSFVSDVVKGDSFAFVCAFCEDSLDEDFETDLFVWLREHANINKFLSSRGEEWVLMNEPTRDLRLSFVNKSNDSVCVSLGGCKIVDIINDNTLVMFVSTAQFVK